MKKNIISQKLKRSVLTAMLSLSIIPGVASAAIAPDVSAPNVAVNVKDGVEIININEANASGLSHNVFTQFDVSSSGAVFNNSVNDVNSQLAGMINGNSNFVNGIAAQTVLNEVVSNNPSSLNGIMEIAGQKANLIIANQKGITGNGLGFINTDRAILTTGNPVLNEAGALTGFNVTEGTVAIAGTNNTLGADTTELLSKKVDVNGNITANVLKVVTGSNAINFADLAYSNTNSDISNTGYAIDISAIGGMNGNSIYLMSSDKGVGVNNEGLIKGINEIFIDSTGDILNSSYIVANNKIELKTDNNIENYKVIFSKNNLSIESRNQIFNGADGLVNASNELNTNSYNFTNKGNFLSGMDVEFRKIANGTMKLIVENSLDNEGNLYASNNVNLNIGYIMSNDGNIYSDDSLIINSEEFTGEAYRITNNNLIAALRNVSITSHFLENTGAIVAGYDENQEKYLFENGAINIIGLNGNINNTGVIESTGNANISTGGDLYNSGSITSYKNLNLNISGDFDNDITDTRNGMLLSNEKMLIEARSINNRGDIVSFEDSLKQGPSSRIYGIEINGRNNIDLSGNIISNNGDILINSYTGLISTDGTTISSINSNISGGFGIQLLADQGGIIVKNSKILSDKSIKTQSDYNDVLIQNSKYVNSGTGPLSFFGQEHISVQSSNLSSGDMLALKAANVNLENSNLSAKGNTMIFASWSLINTGNIVSKGYINNVMSQYGTFNNSGKMLAGDYLQIYGSPYFQNLGVLGSDSDISLWGRGNTVVTEVRAPQVLLNGYNIPGTVGYINATVDMNSNDLLIGYTLHTIDDGVGGNLANAASSAFNLSKNTFSNPTIDNIEDAEEIFVVSGFFSTLANLIVPELAVPIGAVSAYNDYSKYNGYAKSLDGKFGDYDEITGNRLINGNYNDALDFVNSIAKSENGWTEIPNDDNIVMKLSPDGMLIITVTAPTLAEPNTIVNIHGLEGTIKHLPYYTEQTIKFVEQV